MLFADGFVGLLFLGLWIFCFIDVLLTPEGACRNLPKLAWVFIVLLLSDVGSIAWLVAGRPWDRVGLQARGVGGARGPGGAGGRYADYDGPNRRPSRQVPTNPDDDEEFLASLRLRAEEQRRRAREAQQAQQPPQQPTQHPTQHPTQQPQQPQTGEQDEKPDPA